MTVILLCHRSTDKIIFWQRIQSNKNNVGQEHEPFFSISGKENRIILFFKILLKQAEMLKSCKTKRGGWCFGMVLVRMMMWIVG